VQRRRFGKAAGLGLATTTAGPMFLRAGTPAPIIERLNRETVKQIE
jgi:hypothetical protein